MKKMNQNIFVNQVRGYNIGNFIMLTPTIKALSTYYNTKIPVYFGCPYTQELFTNCDFIKIISHHKKHKEILSSRWINQKESDWSYIFKLRMAITINKVAIPIKVSVLIGRDVDSRPH